MFQQCCMNTSRTQMTLFVFYTSYSKSINADLFVLFFFSLTPKLHTYLSVHETKQNKKPQNIQAQCEFWQVDKSLKSVKGVVCFNWSFKHRYLGFALMNTHEQRTLSLTESSVGEGCATDVFFPLDITKIRERHCLQLKIRTF